MKHALLSFVFLMGSSLMAPAISQAQTNQIDFEKVNEVLSQVGSSLIEGDDLFTSLSAKIDASQTDLEQQRVAGEMSASVSQTAWSEAPSSLRVTGSFVNKDKALGQNQEELAQIEGQLEGTLTTPVINMIQFGWSLYHCAPEAMDRVMTPYEYLQLKVCPTLNERVPSLKTGEELVQLIQGTVDLIKGSLTDYIALTQEELDQTQDEDLRNALLYFLEAAQKYQRYFSEMIVTNNGSSIDLETTFNFGSDKPATVTLNATLSEETLLIGATILSPINKEDVDWYFSTLKEVLIGLQNRDQEAIDSLKSSFKNYLDMVRSIISG